ncbi:MAG: HlyD family efflux transporter periplasmic adaptor subunit [Spirulina sp.]
MVGIFGSAIALSALLKYNVTVKAPAVVRPEGDLRIVESTATGPVRQILVTANDEVQQGDPLVVLDDAEVRSRQQQIQAELDQLQRQQQHIQQERVVLDSQIQAETRAAEGAIAAAQAQLDLRQRNYREQQATTAADLREANAAMQFAQEELNRYRQLANTGALADLQLKEKEAALETALARLDRTRGRINPSAAAIEQAEEEMRQTQARGESTLANLRQTQQALTRQQAELEQQIQSQQQTLQQVNLELARLVVQAPVTGTIQSLNLRNPNQVLQAGDVIAQIAPSNVALIIQAQVSQADAGRVQVGQQVNVRIDSCPYTDYGVLHGQVMAIAPDTETESPDPSSAKTLPFYWAEIAPQTSALPAANHTCHLQAGMLGRADIVTQRETFLKGLARRLWLVTDL